MKTIERAVGRERGVIVDVERIAERALVGAVGGRNVEAQLAGLRKDPGDGQTLRIGCRREAEADDGDEEDGSHPQTISLFPTGR